MIISSFSHSRRLLSQALKIYQSNEHLREASRDASRGGFATGARWMARALAHLRNRSESPQARWRPIHYHLAGWTKYGLCAGAALIILLIAITTGWWFLLPVVPLVFYLTEAQFVFLFPLMIDDNPHPFRNSPGLTRKAGGTWKVTATVLPLAWHMLTGGLFGQGFIRSWCLGCLAVVIWYEELQT